MSGHNSYGPSKTEMYSSCAGAIALIAALPDYMHRVGGAAAQLGTCVHGLIERCLGEGSEPAAYEGRIIAILNEGEENESVSILRKSARAPKNTVWYEIDSDIIDPATVMTDYVRGRCKLLRLDPLNREELELESRTNPLPDRDDTSGTADVTIKAWPVVLELVDYKNGYLFVGEKRNKQVMSYLLGKALESNFEFGTYMLTIVQPNSDTDRGVVRSFTVSAAELREYQAELRAAIELCDKAAADKKAPQTGFDKIDSGWAKKYLKAATPSNGGKDWCTFCDAKAICPAFRARVQAQAQMDFDDEPADLPQSVNTKTVSQILKWKPKFEELFRAAVLFATRALENGHAVEGYGLFAGRSTRKLPEDQSPDEIADNVSSRFKVAREKLFSPPKLKSGPQIEKLIPAKQRKAFASEFLTKPKGRETLQPIASGLKKGPALNTSTADAFPDDQDDDMEFG